MQEHQSYSSEKGALRNAVLKCSENVRSQFDSGNTIHTAAGKQDCGVTHGNARTSYGPSLTLLHKPYLQERSTAEG
jgi:hypothetical protein